MAPFLSHVHGDAVDVELELEVDPVAAFHGARRTRQSIAPESRVGATPTASLHGSRCNLIRTVLKNVKNNSISVRFQLIKLIILQLSDGKCSIVSKDYDNFVSSRKVAPYLYIRSNRPCPSGGSSDMMPGK